MRVSIQKSITKEKSPHSTPEPSIQAPEQIAIRKKILLSKHNRQKNDDSYEANKNTASEYTAEDLQYLNKVDAKKPFKGRPI